MNEQRPTTRPWPIVRLGNICETSSGGTPSRGKPEYWEGGTIPWLKSGEVSQGNIYGTEESITQLGLERSSAKIFPRETVVVAMYGATAGQVGVLKISSSTNQAVCGILPNDRVWAGFLYRVLQSRVSYLVLQSTGGAQPNISQTVIRNLNIPLPSIGEQQRIAAKLDEQMAALDRAEQALSEQEAAASAFTTAVLQQVFCGLESGRWPQVQLGEVAASDLTQVRPDDEFAKDLPYVGMEDIESQTGRIIAPSAHSDIRSNTFAFNERHVLYGKLRPYLNKVALPESRGRCSTELVPLLPKAGLDRRYLVWFLRRPETVSAAMQEKTGSRMPRASMRNIAQLRIPLPPLSHQKRVVTSLERVSAELTSLQQHFADQRMDLAALRSSLLNAAFSGEI